MTERNLKAGIGWPFVFSEFVIGPASFWTYSILCQTFKSMTDETPFVYNILRQRRTSIVVDEESRWKHCFAKNTVESIVFAKLEEITSCGCIRNARPCPTLLEVVVKEHSIPGICTKVDT
jgi:hypothetical protein